MFGPSESKREKMTNILGTGCVTDSVMIKAFVVRLAEMNNSNNIRLS